MGLQPDEMENLALAGEEGRAVKCSTRDLSLVSVTGARLSSEERVKWGGVFRYYFFLDLELSLLPPRRNPRLMICRISMSRCSNYRRSNNVVSACSWDINFRHRQVNNICIFVGAQIVTHSSCNLDKPFQAVRVECTEEERYPSTSLPT